MKVAVEAQIDFLQKLAARGRPAGALAELIWNGLDADASEVEVSLEKNLLDGVEAIRVVDNGVGFSLEAAQEGFGKLGGSWKKTRERTPGEGRLLHGKDGKGRFRAFALGARVRWESCVLQSEDEHGVCVEGTAEDLKHFEIQPVEIDRMGTTVIVSQVWDDLPNLEHARVREELTEVLALYLRKYPSVQITYLGARVSPDLIEDRSTVISMEPIEIDGTIVDDIELEIVEWERPTSRSLYLCDDEGFTLSRTAPHIHAPGFHFTAYLRTSFFRTIEDSLSLGEAHPGLQLVLDAAKTHLRNHFRARSADQVREQVVSWRESDVYPYAGEPQDAVEKAERQVFDVLAYNVAQYMPTFAAADKGTQRFSFKLLRQAIEENPESLRRILVDVLELPPESQDELAGLLERTSLAGMITAAKEVTDRLSFLRGLELLVFNPESKKQLLERAQLHRILAEEAWVFGEEFRLTLDDQSLTEVLKKHEAILRRELPETVSDNLSVEDLPEVLREDGSRGIVDLMLSRRVPQGREEEREHLVVELKRPSQTINSAVAQQIRSYAFAVQRDERFRDTKTRWEFWAVSNRITDQVRWEMEDRPNRILKKSDNLTVRVVTWGELLETCRARLTFFQERLRYVPDDEDAVGHLRALYNRYLPKALVDNAAEADGT